MWPLAPACCQSLPSKTYFNSSFLKIDFLDFKPIALHVRPRNYPKRPPPLGGRRNAPAGGTAQASSSAEMANLRSCLLPPSSSFFLLPPSSSILLLILSSSPPPSGYSTLPNKRRGVSKRWTSLSGPPCEDLSIEPNLWSTPTGNVGQVLLWPVPTEPPESPVGQDPPAHTCHHSKLLNPLWETLDGLWPPPCAHVPLFQIQSAPTRNV